MSKKMIHTIYRQKHFKTTEDGEKYWEDSYSFYQGERDFEKSDWRICEVPNKRKEISRIGTAEIKNFPIQYPLQLSDGTFINKIPNPIEYITD